MKDFKKNNLEKKVDGLLSRSVFQVLPSKEVLKKALLSGKRLRIFHGADATGSQLHLGHSTNFLLLEKFRQLGHEVILLFGDFTAMIGDPTGESEIRKQLTREEVESNIATWKEQVSPILNFSDETNPVRIVRNSEWLDKLSFPEMVKLASHFTVQQMSERDMFEKRIEAGKPVFLHEFLYPLLQGYDSVALDVDVEIGGSDQTFNMLAGRTLQKVYHGKEKFILSTTLLANPETGVKLMSKSKGGFIALNDDAREMFGKVMALPDGVIRQVFVDCTFLPVDEIGAILKADNPRDAKVRLAKEIVAIYHGGNLAEEAEEFFISTFSKGEAPSDVRETVLSESVNILDLLVQERFAGSRADARRKVEQGGVEIDGKKITDREFMIEKSDTPQLLKSGKKDFVRIVFEK